MSALLGHEGDLAEPERRALRTHLRAGETGRRDARACWPALKANIADQIAIDQPNYKPEGSLPPT